MFEQLQGMNNNVALVGSCTGARGKINDTHIDRISKALILYIHRLNASSGYKTCSLTSITYSSSKFCWQAPQAP